MGEHGRVTMRKLAVSQTTLLQARVAVVSLLFWLSYLLLPSPSRADSPTEQIPTTVEQTLSIIRSPNSKSKVSNQDRRAQLAEVIYSRFDFAEMSKRSLGPHWARRTAEEKREFVKVFAGLLGRTYMAKIESYGTQTILYTREVKDENYAQVDTKIVAADTRDSWSINYKLHSVKNEWKVYDLLIEDISLVNNYRSQFDRIITRTSFLDLVRVMKEKQSVGSAMTARMAGR